MPKRRKITERGTERVTRARAPQPLFSTRRDGYLPRKIRRVFPTKRAFAVARDERIALAAGRKGQDRRTIVMAESKKIRTHQVRSILSLLSPFRCKEKRAIARREYLSMRAAGKGSRKIKNGSRFTVRC